jgi:hypothetical protein
MKAVIVDLQGKYAAALDETGSVLRIPNAAYRIGQEIELHEVPHARPNLRRRMAATAAAAVLVLGLGTGTAYAIPYGTVSLDATPSIEYTVNCFNYVLDVKAENEEAETVLSEVGKKNLRHRKITEAIETTVEQIREDGYLDEEDSTLQIRAEGRTERHSQQLQKQLDAEFARDLPMYGQDGKPELTEKPEPENAPAFFPEDGNPGGRNPDARTAPDAMPDSGQMPDFGDAQAKEAQEEMREGAMPSAPDAATEASFADRGSAPEAPVQSDGMIPPEGMAPPQGSQENPPPPFEHSGEQGPGGFPSGESAPGDRPMDFPQ